MSSRLTGEVDGLFMGGEISRKMSEDKSVLFFSWSIARCAHDFSCLASTTIDERRSAACSFEHHISRA